MRSAYLLAGLVFAASPLLAQTVPARATVALTMLFDPLGLLKHGNDVKYPAGTKVTVYTDQQITVKVAQ